MRLKAESPLGIRFHVFNGDRRAFIATVPASALDGTEDKEITFPAGPGKTRTLNGQNYLTGWMLPNMYFHITTAYTILRHNGVEVGKIDYLLGAQG